ncbi:SDR family oxidoreductase [Larkinella sp. VNQ87]|uniref:SDR family oxidoreductase n=1 Tax=Larkinella sp. VNQ87 TaxID=3400921 RepID=UPI003C03C00B
MKTQNNTVLITGGSAGIGFEIAKLFAKTGNQVIITGRNAERLQKAAAQLPNATAIVSDVSKPEDVEQLVERLHREFPTLNLVVNNAGRAFYYLLSEDGVQATDKAAEEISTNYLSIVRLTEKLLPLLKKQPEAAFVNVSSIVAFVPNHVLATYAASKAALHSYTQALRFTLAKDTAIKVFELMPPLVNTEFSEAIGGANGISPTVVAEDLLRALETDTQEIHVGATADIYQLFRSSPADALLALNSRQ